MGKILDFSEKMVTIIKASNKEIFEANEIMTIMKTIKKIFTQDYNITKFLTYL
jgi:hypothetical protein